MANQARIYYPIQAVGFAAVGVEHTEQGYIAAKGVQSVSFNTNFNLEQVFELGQLELYENIENIPDVDITVEKAIDGYALLEHLATPGATTSTLAGRYNDNTCMFATAYYDIAQENASGDPLATVVMSGCYVSAINWTLPVEGNLTESITMVANNKVWYTGAAATGSPWTSATQFTGGESPILGPSAASGGIQRRENVIMGTGFYTDAANNSLPSLFPTELPGINSNGENIETAGAFASHIQNVTVGVTLNRTDLFELGRRGQYFRYAEFPTEVTCAIETTSTELGDQINAFEESENLTDQTIIIRLDQGITLDLGTKNKLASINTAGGDTGGGNVTVTYNYSNFNDLKVLMPATDPAGLTA